jgi:hypothetical protein
LAPEDELRGTVARILSFLKRFWHGGAIGRSLREVRLEEVEVRGGRG